MTDKVLEQFDQAATALEGVLAGIKPLQLDDPTPCPEWSVRELVNHVVGGNLMFAGIVSGNGPAAPQDHGDDLLGAFRSSFSTLREAFAADGVLERTFQTPMGERPATRLVTIRVIEMGLHGWDLAKATGQSFALPEEVVDAALNQLKAMLPADRQGLPYGNEQPAAPDASPTDRLAAFAGRSLN
ncbi:TIGR03086 family metal-binding protein [Streptomyces diastatochromogenes]|uniref:TIGR03086 family metal-binding protein n=1 Tax=Streptomyces diastatochromogenes TaxID=42236 RepID=UPI0036CB0667